MENDQARSVCGFLSMGQVTFLGIKIFYSTKVSRKRKMREKRKHNQSIQDL